jgi:hypothetical protein
VILWGRTRRKIACRVRIATTGFVIEHTNKRNNNHPTHAVDNIFNLLWRQQLDNYTPIWLRMMLLIAILIIIVTDYKLVYH